MEKTHALRYRIAPLEMSPSEFRKAGYRLIDQVAYDPLLELAAISREYGLWFHVNGAYGALAAVLLNDEESAVPPDLRGIREADSVAVDPHKWLYAPLEAGCASVREAEHLRDVFSYHPPYYRF